MKLRKKILVFVVEILLNGTHTRFVWVFIHFWILLNIYSILMMEEIKLKRGKKTFEDKNVVIVAAVAAAVAYEQNWGHVNRAYCLPCHFYLPYTLHTYRYSMYFFFHMQHKENKNRRVYCIQYVNDDIYSTILLQSINVLLFLAVAVSLSEFFSFVHCIYWKNVLQRIYAIIFTYIHIFNVAQFCFAFYKHSFFSSILFSCFPFC